MREKGGRLKLCGLGPYVREVFTITKLDTVLGNRSPLGYFQN